MNIHGRSRFNSSLDTDPQLQAAAPPPVLRSGQLQRPTSGLIIVIWLAILVGSAFAGALCAKIDPPWLSLLAGAATPWFGFLAILLVDVYVLPYRGGGASMWPIAQLFGGTAAALFGLGSCMFFRGRRRAKGQSV